jgi:DNA-binding GntR family transcriptional regulator
MKSTRKLAAQRIRRGGPTGGIGEAKRGKASATPVGSSPSTATSVDTAREGIRKLIVGRQLSPGEQIRQEELATLLNTSRSPIREALQALHSEGIVAHHPNRGYFVTRLSADKIEQIFMVRTLLETELLKDLDWPTRAQLQRLRKFNAAISVAAERYDVSEIIRLNHEFHFGIFALSRFDLLIDELRRLWSLSDPYRALYLWDSVAQTRTVSDHDEILAALESHDRELLIMRVDEHRQVSASKLLALLSEPAVRV